MRTPGFGLNRFSSTSGVWPIAWTMSPYLPPHGRLSRRGSIIASESVVGYAHGRITMVSTFTVETPSGPARVHLHPVGEPLAALVLGHGAGGGVEAPDLVAATEAALA